MTRVQHINRDPVDRGARTDIIQRVDARLISLAKGQVYFVPEGRLLDEKDANAALRRYKEEAGQSLRS